MSVKLIASKLIAGLQTLLGSFATGLAGNLVTHKDWRAFITPPISPPPNNQGEIRLMYLGIVIIVCGFIQGLIGIKTGWWQVICGAGIATVSFLASKSALDYFDASPIYFFVTIPFGIVIIVTGLMQLLPAMSHRPRK